MITQARAAAKCAWLVSRDTIMKALMISGASVMLCQSYCVGHTVHIFAERGCSKSCQATTERGGAGVVSASLGHGLPQCCSLLHLIWIYYISGFFSFFNPRSWTPLICEDGSPVIINQEKRQYTCGPPSAASPGFVLPSGEPIKYGYDSRLAGYTFVPIPNIRPSSQRPRVPALRRDPVALLSTT